MFGIIYALCQSLRIYENIGIWPSITGDTTVDCSVIRVVWLSTKCEGDSLYTGVKINVCCFLFCFFLWPTEICIISPKKLSGIMVKGKVVVILRWNERPRVLSCVYGLHTGMATTQCKSWQRNLNDFSNWKDALKDTRPWSYVCLIIHYILDFVYSRLKMSPTFIQTDKFPLFLTKKKRKKNVDGNIPEML